MNLNLRYISLYYVLLLLLYRNIAIVISVFWSEEWIQLGRIWVFLTEDFFCARSDGGWRKKSSSQATVVDGYDFDMVDYTDYYRVSLFVSHKS